MRGLPHQYLPVPYGKGEFLSLHLWCGVLMTAASALATVVDPDFWTVFGLLFFGASLALAEANRRRRRDDKTLARVEPFVRRLRPHDVDGYGWLLRVLADLDGRTPRARHRGRLALDTLSTDGRLIDALIAHCRRRRIGVDVFAGRAARRGAGDLAVVLASLHPDGQTREAAVTALGRLALRPAHLPFLVERAVDWVPEVRAAAHHVLRTRLGQHPHLLSPARLAGTRVARRKHAPALARLLAGAEPRPAPDG